ncbi:50S ribosomal protein L23 [Sesbania bispinosa]|nr:50S ribosomal protein L23 [Sesbania bispinosa]
MENRRAWNSKSKEVEVMNQRGPYRHEEETVGRREYQRKAIPTLPLHCQKAPPMRLWTTGLN